MIAANEVCKMNLPQTYKNFTTKGLKILLMVIKENLNKFLNKPCYR